MFGWSADLVRKGFTLDKYADAQILLWCDCRATVLVHSREIATLSSEESLRALHSCHV